MYKILFIAVASLLWVQTAMSVERKPESKTEGLITLNSEKFSKTDTHQKSIATSESVPVTINLEHLEAFKNIAKEIIYKHKSKSEVYDVSEYSEGDYSTTTINLDADNLEKTNLEIDLLDFKLKKISINGVSYFTTKYPEDAEIRSISFISIDKHKTKAIIYFDEEGIFLQVSDNGYDYVVSGKSDGKIVKKKKAFIDNGLNRDQEFEYKEKTSNLIQLEPKTKTLSSTWPNKSVPAGLNPVEKTNGIAILYIIHPDLYAQYGEARLRQYFMVPGIERINNVFGNDNFIDDITMTSFHAYVSHYINSNGIPVFGYIVAPPSLCPNNYCTSNYNQLLGKMNTNSDIRAVKAEWNADVVMFIHSVPDYTNQVFGLANIPSSPYDQTFKNYANSVVYAQKYQSYVFAHEFFHSLGARHSRANPTQPGVGTENAHIGYFEDFEHIPTENYGYRSFMAYKDVCETVTGDSNCDLYDRMSSPSTYVEIVGFNRTVRLGSTYSDNKYKVAKMLRTVANFSH